MSDDKTPRGCLSKLQPERRAVMVLLLTGALVFLLFICDREGFLAAWRDRRLELIERILNIILAVGTIWVVLFEGDAILAALAKAFASRFGVTFTFIAEALKRAGMAAASIQEILADMLSRIPPAEAAAARTQFNEAMAMLRPEGEFGDPTRPTPRQKHPSEGIPASESMSMSSKAPRGVLRWILFTGVGVVGLSTLVYCDRRTLPPAPPSDDTAEPYVEAEHAIENWIVARGSISQTLTECLGRKSWAELERVVAATNGIACSEQARGFHCTIQDAQPIRLPSDIKCRPSVNVFPSFESAGGTNGSASLLPAERARSGENYGGVSD